MNRIPATSPWKCVVCHEENREAHGGAVENPEHPIHIDCTAALVPYEGEPPKGWCCSICHEEDPTIKGKLVIHGDKIQHPFHADCLKTALKINGPMCPHCRDLIYYNEPEKMSFSDALDWFWEMQPWICGYFGRRHIDMVTVSSFCHSAVAFTDLYTTRYNYFTLINKIRKIDQFLYEYDQKAFPSDSEQVWRKHHLLTRPLLVQRLKEYDNLYHFHLVRTIAMGTVGLYSLWKWLRQVK